MASWEPEPREREDEDQRVRWDDQVDPWGYDDPPLEPLEVDRG